MSIKKITTFLIKKIFFCKNLWLYFTDDTFGKNSTNSYS